MTKFEARSKAQIAIARGRRLQNGLGRCRRRPYRMPRNRPILLKSPPYHLKLPTHMTTAASAPITVRDMRIDKLLRLGRPTISFEVLPPYSDAGFAQLYQTAGA